METLEVESSELLEIIQRLFPLKGKITQEIIDTANIYKANLCIGALTLKEALSNAGIEGIGPNIGWGAIKGIIYAEPAFDENGVYLTSSDKDFKLPIKISVGTEERINMMDIKSPTKLTFIFELVENN